MSVLDSGHSTAARSVLVLSAAALAVTDLSVKAALVQALGHDSHDTDFGLFTVRVAYDTGAGFGPLSWLPPGALVLGAVALGAVLGALLVRAAPRLRKPALLGAALLLGGALGNLVDLLDGDGVVDYLHTGWLPSSNLAGVFVVAGAGLLVLGTVRGAVREGQ
ncbi:signal peptidase II [Arthrobacter oryzae]|uniref:signal peptidase II n=1 Tax=Arthrobacter oryzae TaxID=409290 RepID=UPI002782203E|nr:signal peptidase II [Arthrobacter oryzae]MDP9988753.1 signal peptidase II [Arthrobacter oryzae]